MEESRTGQSLKLHKATRTQTTNEGTHTRDEVEEMRLAPAPSSSRRQFGKEESDTDAVANCVKDAEAKPARPKPGMCLSSDRLKLFERVERAQTRILLFSKIHCSVDKIRHVYSSPLLEFSSEYFV
ncbi:hypothetical protein DPX16_12998 [Anabarilius grahami]|uniref:Uncharacterized protein n=1 Tax=Anabarilius grahami TaxID=495550 RepID=A0A3N0XDJ7_ANAGA|nr:hypothetical protein DPX16_12998 [Anabarilius grahami]